MGQEPGIFINIRMIEDGQLQLQTNAPPGHFMSMIEAARATFIQRAVQAEQGASGIVVPPPGTRLR